MRPSGRQNEGGLGKANKKKGLGRFPPWEFNRKSRKTLEWARWQGGREGGAVASQGGIEGNGIKRSEGAKGVGSVHYRKEERTGKSLKKGQVFVGGEKQAK